MLVGASVRLARPIAAGGMGSIWLGEHLTLRTPVAVKFLSAELWDDPDAHARFNREATAAAQLRSPHVVQILDHGVTDDGTPYIVMELLEGEDLSQRLQRVRTLSMRATASIVVQACRALSRAHAHDVVHRDIKPNNLFLLDQDGETFVKLLDFGIAKTLRAADMAVTSTGKFLGTPLYMSPEQMASTKDVDFRSDLWSLGVVAYHCLVGRAPFDAETFGGLCIAINRGEYTPVSHCRPGFGPDVDGWFEKALAVDPARRFASAKAMAAALTIVVQIADATLAVDGPGAAPWPAGPPAARAPATLHGSSRTDPSSREPAARRGRRRAPVVLAGLALTGLGAAAGLVLTRHATRSNSPQTTVAEFPTAAEAEATTPGGAAPSVRAATGTPAVDPSIPNPPSSGTPDADAASAPGPFRATVPTVRKPTLRSVATSDVRAVTSPPPGPGASTAGSRSAASAPAMTEDTAPKPRDRGF
jgi:serine/threonine-protein kinase